MSKKPITEMQLPQPDAAAGVLEEVYQRALFGKLAAVYGIAPETAEQKAAVLSSAAKLREFAAQPQVKQAAAASDPFIRADNDLQRFLGGAVKQASSAETNVAINQAALAYSAHPDVYSAVLSLTAAAKNSEG